MKQENARAKFALAGATSALLLGLACAPSFASQGFKSDCVEMNEAPSSIELPARSYVIRHVDHGLTDSAADMKDPAGNPIDEKVNSPALADVSDGSRDNAADTDAEEKEVSVPSDDLPESAVRLPGVSEEDYPRFRRQMYRTDI